MSSRSGPRAQGTDGTDFLHRQRIAAHYQESANYKFILKFILLLHVSILIFMWTKVGSELLRVHAGITAAWIEKADLPSAYPWEYVYCFSFIAIIFALLAFPRNKIAMINRHYYAHFFLGIFPCVIGMGQQLPELFDFMSNKDTLTPTFKGWFPMFAIWYVFFLVALQIHGFAMYFSYQLSAAWTPVKKE